MPENWKTYKLEDLGTIVTGKTPSSKHPEHFGNHLPFVTPTDFSDYHKNVSFASRYLSTEGAKLFKSKILPPNSILVTCIGSQMGKVVVNKIEVLTNQQLNSIIPNNNANSDFLYYKLSSIHEQLRTMAGAGSTMPMLNKSDFGKIEIEIPEIEEQKSIVSILSALDDKIELNLQMNKTLEDMAMALYKHWFVDFGPLQDGEFVDSELGKIPKGWEVNKLGDLFKLKHGFAFKGKHFQLEERDELLLTPGNFQSSGGIKFNWGKQKFYSGDFPDEYILTKGDLIIALTDLTQSCDILGAPAIIPDNDYKYLHNQRLGLVTDLLPQFSNDFIYCIANSRDFRNFIRNSKTGSTVSHTSPTRIYDYKLALPTQGLETNFRKELNNLLELTFTNSSENQTLTQLRDTLLPKLISGEVRVKDVEKTLSEIL